MTKVPFLDLISIHKDIESDFMEVFRRSLETGRFIGGEYLTQFEKDFAEFCESDYCVGVSSGTDAVRFALIATGVKDGDVVITTPNTFIATTEAITQAGGIPEFVDIDEKTYNISPEKLKTHLENHCSRNSKGELISKRNNRPVSAIVPVHLYGQIADMDAVLELAEEYSLFVVEDACQAHGASYYSQKEGKWKKAGSFGDAAAFSFYPGKNLGALGEGGAVTTTSKEISDKCSILRDHGQSEKYIHKIEGYNGRLDAIQAGFLGIKLKKLPDWNEKRINAAEIYNKKLSGIDGVKTPYVPESSNPVYHLYVIQVDYPKGLQKHLNSNNIGSGFHYPIPLHLQEAYSFLGYNQGDFTVTEGVAEKIISVPLFPGISEVQIDSVAESIYGYIN